MLTMGVTFFDLLLCAAGPRHRDIVRQNLCGNILLYSVDAQTRKILNFEFIFLKLIINLYTPATLIQVVEIFMRIAFRIKQGGAISKAIKKDNLFSYA